MKTKRRFGTETTAPSRREIMTACRDIQSGWNDNERRKRAGLPKAEPWNPPTIRSAQLGADVEFEGEF